MSRRAWLRQVPRLAAAIAAKACWVRRDKTALAGCRRRSKETSCLRGLVSLRRPPTIEPIVACAQFFSAHRPHRQIAHERLGSSQPIDAALAARELLGTEGSMPARTLIGAQRVGRVVEIFAEHIGKHRGIL